MSFRYRHQHILPRRRSDPFEPGDRRTPVGGETSSPMFRRRRSTRRLRLAARVLLAIGRY
jgi:hypothetical protein